MEINATKLKKKKGTRNNCTTTEKCKIFDFVLLAHFSMSAAGGFPGAALKTLGLCVQAFLTTKTHAKSLQTAGGQSVSIIPFCFQLQSPEHPKSNSTVFGFRQCFVNHLRKIE